MWIPQDEAFWSERLQALQSLLVDRQCVLKAVTGKLEKFATQVEEQVSVLGSQLHGAAVSPSDAVVDQVDVTICVTHVRGVIDAMKIAGGFQ